MSQTNTQGQEAKMGENERNKLHQFLKMTLQFLVSLSLLSFLLSCSSHLSCYFHDFSFHFSTLVFPVFGQALDKKYMFLICNGIIAFLAKNSSFTRASPTGGAHLISDEFANTNEDGMKPMWAAPLEHKEAPLEHKEAAMESKAKSMEIGARIGSESPVMIRETEAEVDAGYLQLHIKSWRRYLEGPQNGVGGIGYKPCNFEKASSLSSAIIAQKHIHSLKNR